MILDNEETAARFREFLKYKGIWKQSTQGAIITKVKRAAEFVDQEKLMTADPAKVLDTVIPDKHHIHHSYCRAYVSAIKCFQDFAKEVQQ